MFSTDTVESNYVLYSPHTDLGRYQGLGNHLYIFYTTYSYCIDNGIEMRIDEDAHPVMKNMLLQKQKRMNNSYYSIEHLSDLKANGIPFQMHDAQGSSDINGFDFSLYKHNIPKIQQVLNVPDEPLDACIMHVRVYTSIPHLNVGLPFYMNALKHVKSKRVIIMSGYSNFDIKEDVTKKNVDYLISRLAQIYPDKEFIDIRTIPEYLDENADIEAMKHWYLCVNCKELIAPPSTFSLSAAMIRGNRLTITPKHQNLYGAIYDLRTVADNIIYITRNVIVSAWYDTKSMPKDQLAHRVKHIDEFFDRINNADIIIFTNNTGIFNEKGIQHLSHIHIIELPFEHLYAYQFRDTWSKQSELYPNNDRLSCERLTIWLSKIWFIHIASVSLHDMYDKIAWMDLCVFKSSEIHKRQDVFPLLERYLIPRVSMSTQSSCGSVVSKLLFYHPNVGSFIICPAPVYAHALFKSMDITLRACISGNIFIEHDEAFNAILIDLIGDFFNLSFDKAVGYGNEHGWHHWYFDYSESFKEFTCNIYNDITIRPPKLETSHLQQFLAILANMDKNNPS